MQANDNWESIHKKWPEFGQVVFVYCVDGTVALAQYIRCAPLCKKSPYMAYYDLQRARYFQMEELSHWYPLILPKPPLQKVPEPHPNRDMN